jgi:hypothetical protein
MVRKAKSNFHKHQQKKLGILYYTRRNGAAGLDTVLKAERSRVRFPLRSLEFLIDLILPTVTLGSTQTVTENSTRDISWGVKAAGAQG